MVFLQIVFCITIFQIKSNKSFTSIKEKRTSRTKVFMGCKMLLDIVKIFLLVEDSSSWLILGKILIRLYVRKIVIIV